jgi:hypothetical protein
MNKPSTQEEIAKKKAKRSNFIYTSLGLTILVGYKTMSANGVTDNHIIAFIIMATVFWGATIIYIYFTPLEKKESTENIIQSSKIKPNIDLGEPIKQTIEDKINDDIKVKIKSKISTLFNFIKQKNKDIISNKKTTRTILLSSTILLVILFITNPSISDFKGYCEFDIPIKDAESKYISRYEYHHHNSIASSRTYARTSYWLIFSIYEVKIKKDNYKDYDEERYKYIGIFNSFYKIQ